MTSQSTPRCSSLRSFLCASVLAVSETLAQETKVEGVLRPEQGSLLSVEFVFNFGQRVWAAIPTIDIVLSLSFTSCAVDPLIPGDPPVGWF